VFTVLKRILSGGDPPFSLGELFDFPARRSPGLPIWLDRPLDIAPQLGETLNLQQAADLVGESARWMVRAGVRPGDRVVVLKRPNLDITILASAIASIGAVPALIHPEVGRDNAAILLRRLVRPHVLTDRETREQGTLAIPQFEELAQTAMIVDHRSLDVHRLQPPSEERPIGLTPSVVLITHTSGTTGVPKLVGYSGASLIHHVEAQSAVAALMRLRGIAAGLMSFVHGRIYSALAVVTRRAMPLVVLTDPTPSKVRELFLAHPPEVIETYPNVFLLWEELADDPAQPLARVKYFLNTFDAPHPRTIERMLNASRRFAPAYLQAYGNTESGVLTVRGYHRQTVRHVHSRCVGYPLPGFTQVRVAQRNGSEATDAGEIHIRSEGVADTYIGQSDIALPERGAWRFTGDLGYRSKFGCLHLVDRAVDESGELGSTLLVEDKLLSRLPVREAIVVPTRQGMPQPILCPWDGRPVDEASWRRASADLPPMLPPIQCGFDALPRTATWKIRRLEIRRRIDAGEPLPTLAEPPAAAASPA
jgi:acyl-coenzyme A synthetase/AMP-(fatty) acid ligase